MRTKTLTAAAVALATSAGLLCSSASAAVFPFQVITPNEPDAGAVGESQFQLEVLAGPAGAVHFTVSNDGPVYSSISGLFVDDEPMSILAPGSAGVINSAGVDIRVGHMPPGPPVLPGGNLINFVETFIFNSAAPPPTKGVNPGEWVTLTFGLNPGFGLTDVIDAISSGHLRLGVHAIAFDVPGEPSASFVVVPEPGLAGAALGMLGLLCRRRRR